MLKKVLLTLLLITWMIIIFMFSNQSGTDSLKVSDTLTKNTINTVSKITNKEIKDKDKVVINSRFLVRKIAHFTLYFVLGMLIYLTLSSYNINKNIILYSIIFCFIYAITDEIHQFLLHSRTFRYLDIFIDTIGSIFGINIINKKISKNTCIFRKNMV